MNTHPVTVGQLYDEVDTLWPFALAEEWDRVGLIVGSRTQPAKKALLVVDVTESTVSEAIAGGYDVVLAHHPLLLKGITSVAEENSKGALVAKLIRGNCALIAAHTNADAPADGVAEVFAEALGLVDAKPIEPNALSPQTGIGRAGTLPLAISARELAERLAELLPATGTGVRVAGAADQLVQRVAICPGAGDSLLEHPAVRAADVYITADLRHHPASESRELAALGGGTPVLMDVSHWASEWLWLNRAAERLRSALPDAEFMVSTLRTDAWDFTVGAHPDLEEGGN